MCTFSRLQAANGGRTITVDVGRLVSCLLQKYRVALVVLIVFSCRRFVQSTYCQCLTCFQVNVYLIFTRPSKRLPQPTPSWVLFRILRVKSNQHPLDHDPPNPPRVSQGSQGTRAHQEGSSRQDTGQNFRPAEFINIDVLVRCAVFLGAEACRATSSRAEAC